MNRLVDQQIRRNSETRSRWREFAGHRDRVTELLIRHRADADPNRSPQRRLCVLGAGNCNDLDLHRLIDAFAEVHLVDLDAEALTAGVTAQGLVDHPALRLHGDHDMTGICRLIDGWSPHSAVDDRSLDRVIEVAGQADACPLEQAVDVVASVCVLSQLAESVVETLGVRHPRFLELLAAVRHRHLQQIVQGTSVGGTGILITDFVSSETAPEIVSAEPHRLAALLAELIERRNFFHGINPAVLMNLLCRDPIVSPMIDSPEFLPPWIWNFGVRHYAVAAIRFQRALTGGISLKPGSPTSRPNR